MIDYLPAHPAASIFYSHTDPSNSIPANSSPSTSTTHKISAHPKCTLPWLTNQEPAAKVQFWVSFPSALGKRNTSFNNRICDDDEFKPNCTHIYLFVPSLSSSISNKVRSLKKANQLWSKMLIIIDLIFWWKTSFNTLSSLWKGLSISSASKDISSSPNNINLNSSSASDNPKAKDSQGLMFGGCCWRSSQSLEAGSRKKNS